MYETHEPNEEENGRQKRYKKNHMGILEIKNTTAKIKILSGEKALSHTVIGRIIFPNVYSVDNVSI